MADFIRKTPQQNSLMGLLGLLDPEAQLLSQKDETRMQYPPTYFGGLMSGLLGDTASGSVLEPGYDDYAQGRVTGGYATKGADLALALSPFAPLVARTIAPRLNQMAENYMFKTGMAQPIVPVQNAGLLGEATKGLPVDTGIKNVETKLRIKPPTDDVYEVMDATFDYAKLGGNKTLPIDQLSGGVRMTDAKEVKRVKDLAEKISSPDGYVSRIIVDDLGNVLEGQHRLEALRLLGEKSVPVAVIEDLSNKYNIPAMEKALEGKFRSDETRQLLKHSIDTLEKAGSIDKALSDFAMPTRFQKPFEDAIKASKDTGINNVGIKLPTTMPHDKAGIQNIADHYVNEFNALGFEAKVEHSGSKAGPSSYVSVYDPTTGGFLQYPIRISNHSKGPFNQQFVNPVVNPLDDLAKYKQRLLDMRARGPSTQFQFNALTAQYAQELMSQGVSPKSAWKQAWKKAQWFLDGTAKP